MPRSAESAARELSDNSLDGPPIFYSPIIDVGDDRLLARLQKIHGHDPCRAHDDLTATLANAASSKVRAG